jgi:hypothetical protein
LRRLESRAAKELEIKKVRRQNVEKGREIWRLKKEGCRRGSGFGEFLRRLFVLGSV